MIKTEYIDIDKCSKFEQIMLLLMSTLKEDDLREDIKDCGFISLGEIERFSRFGIDFQNVNWIQDLISLEDDDPRWKLENKIQDVGKQMLELYEMLNDKIPTNLEECIKKLDTQLSEDDKQFLIDNDALAVHHTLGRYIRNNWGLWKDSELKQNIQKLGYEHPDDMSNFIIKEYIKHLKVQNESSIGYNQQTF